MENSRTEVQRYFAYFDQLIQPIQKPMMYEMYQQLKQKFFDTLASVDAENALTIWTDLLDIDAKLQIMSDLINDDVFELSEQEIIQLTNNDYKNYFRELVGLNELDQVPHSLLFLRQIQYKRCPSNVYSIHNKEPKQ
ncbi:DUF7006 family protein [Enterococcus sp. DIV0876]|uniref:DUF7006 family protein n=1 Tax=Enterococcus sp. DIV0876 TaxID=2774633 RepID=UPI003D2FC7F2